MNGATVIQGEMITVRSTASDNVGVRSVTTVHGGRLDAGPNPPDVWVLRNANGVGGIPAWTKLDPTGGALGREQHGAAFDESNKRMMVFGGFSPAPASDIWVLTEQPELKPLACSQEASLRSIERCDSNVYSVHQRHHQHS